jgi:hypothetical protein
VKAPFEEYFPVSETAAPRRITPGSSAHAAPAKKEAAPDNTSVALRSTPESSFLIIFPSAAERRAPLSGTLYPS